nr:uncharacterized mitochondrial protein AtMg00810-like [Tanacetum cinerariifolium]
MDVKSAFLYGKIEEEVYVCQSLGFKDPRFLDRVYKVEKALYGLHQALRACQDKYVDEILKKFGFPTVKTASTHIKTSKPLLKDAKAKYVDVHLYRSMIGSLMYLIDTRPGIIFTVCACVRFQVTPKVLHLHAVKRIFRYVKGQPKLGLWYFKDSPFELEAYSESDYAGASLDRKSTTRVENANFAEIVDFLNANHIKYALTTSMKMRSVKSKEKSKEKGVSSTRLIRGMIMREASETASRPIVSPQQQLDPKDKGKDSFVPIDSEVVEESKSQAEGKKGIDIYMLVEKEHPLSRGTLTLMLVAKLLVDQDNEMSRELLRKIFMQAERPRR